MVSIIDNTFQSFAKGAPVIDQLIFDPRGRRLRHSAAGRLRAFLLDQLVRRVPSIFVKDVPVSNILMGGENGCFGATFARLTGDVLRPSTPIVRGPHIEFLRAYADVGEAIFRPEQFALTLYWANARRCIEVNGQYFGASTIEGVIEQARRFARMLDGERLPSGGFHSPEGQPVSVRQIKFSDCYEVFDGNHRLAISILCGAESIPCVVLPAEAPLTPMQQLVMDSSLSAGAPSLYQPIDLPEFSTWPDARGCTERLEAMKAFLAERGVRTDSYLDVGSGYGWFVRRMSEQRCEAFGVECDSAAVAVGLAAYGLNPSTVACNDVGSFLSREGRRYDVVSCFDVLRHVATGKGSMPPVDFLRLLDAVTGSLLFLDAGESHAAWFEHERKEWNAGDIGDWLQAHTSFSSIQLAGTNRGPALFVCSRS